MGDRLIRLTYLPEGHTVRIESVDESPNPPVAMMFWYVILLLLNSRD